MSESAYNSPLFPRRMLNESCCSSPARSIGSYTVDILTDSDGEGSSADHLATEVPGMPDQTVISGWLKFRDNKKDLFSHKHICKYLKASNDHVDVQRVPR
ncbi:hypothetical protein HHI36_015460 [Cryptolaemus montrouzieri]|uniref:Uncharacterized protein n=1 Tax=Cryptolaemus montrouzieri TaxID=559131 RepID=A0ABD2N5M3_9CUCU